MKYELYHDESLEGGYWHGMLLVPVIQKEQLVASLGEARKNVGYYDPIGIKKVKEHGRIYDCADSWIQIGIAFLRSQAKGQRYPIFLGRREKGKRVYTFFPANCVGAKFILFCERDKHQQMDQHPDHASKIETTFRMGLKGGLHYLGSEEEPIHIERMHFDGHEHHRRHLDRTRIVGRLSGLREYCSIASIDDLIDDRSSNHRKSDSQDYKDCQLLQLTDLLIGCSRTLLGQSTREFHSQLARPVRAILQRYREGYARMQNSRWRNSFCISRCFLDSGQWSFETIEYGESNTLQMALSF
ncbi:MAG: hypothetical protein IMZ53_01815 [Thermoplasmata archaeon]|nr:hypothetical protein [Thermoplasmata archaeon]